MPLYRISGLTVAAEMELPGVVALSGPPAPEDVEIRNRPVPDELPGVATRGPIWEMDRRRFLLRLPGIGRFLADSGRTLDVEPEHGTHAADSMPFVLGTAFGALLHQRGKFVLHASAVAVDGKAYAFCGRSGIGKSTLAAALCRAGCRFISDDMSAIDLDEFGEPVLWPDGRRLKLFDDSVSLCNLGDSRREAVRSRIGKHYVEPPSTTVDGPVPLGAVYILHEPAVASPSAIERLSRLDAAQMLLLQTYRRRMVLAMGGAATQVRITGSILRSVPVFQLTRPGDTDGLASAIDQLQAHWRALPV